MTLKRYLKTRKKSSQCVVGRKLDGLKNIQPPNKKYIYIVKQMTSPGWMHESSARTWCAGKTQKDRVERELGVGIGMGNT